MPNPILWLAAFTVVCAVSGGSLTHAPGSAALVGRRRWRRARRPGVGSAVRFAVQRDAARFRAGAVGRVHGADPARPDCGDHGGDRTVSPCWR